MKLKLILTIFLGIMFISFASAFLETSKPIELSKGAGLIFNDKEISYNNIWDVYKPIEIKSNWDLPLISSTKLEGYIEKHDFTCGQDCSSEFTLKIYENKPLIEDVRFYTIKEDGSKILQDVRNYQFYIKTNEEEYAEDTYEWQCTLTGKVSANGTAEQTCSNVLTGKVTKKRPLWRQYILGEVVDAGVYTIKLEAEKRPDRIVDWQILSYDWIEDWAVWGNSSLINGLPSYWNFDNPRNFNDTFGKINLTNSGAIITSGKIGQAMNFTETSSAYIYNSTSAESLAYGANQRTFNWWTYLNGDVTSDKYFFSYGVSSGGQFFAPRIGYSGTNQVGFMANGGADFDPGAGAAIVKDKWYMITVTYNGTGITLYINGTLIGGEGSVINTGSSSHSQFCIGARCQPAVGEYFNGTIDELGFWNRSLTQAEITELYNSGNGAQYPFVSSITLNSPAESYISLADSVTFNATATVVGGATLTNMSLWHNASGTWTKNDTVTLTGTTNSTTFTKSFVNGQTVKWGIQACDSDGACGFSENRTFSVDSSPPTINITYPTGALSGLTNGQSLALNYSVSDTNLDTCWREYNGTNTTIASCANTTFTYISGVNNIKVWVNDTVGNVASDSETWVPGVTINSFTFNETSYETSQETFSINATNLTDAFLVYDGTSHSASVSGQIANKTLSLSSSGNKSFYWILNSNSYTSATKYQNVISPVLAPCNATNNVTYVNFTFKDELTSATINGSFNPMTIRYSLGDLTSYKTLTFTNISTNPSYSFCYTPAFKTINTSITAVVDSGTDYPIRYFAYAGLLNNNTLNKTIYLLSSVDGLYQPVTVATGNGIPIAGATVAASTETLGVVESRTTDSSGIASLWLNPDISYTLTTSAPGYPSDVRIINPSSTSIPITLGAVAGFPANSTITYTEGVTYTITPNADYLYNDTTYSFTFILTQGVYVIDGFRFDLYNSSGALLDSESAITSGGTLTSSYNVGKNSKITMVASYTSNGTTNTLSRTWIVMDSDDTGYGLLNLGNRLKTYIGSGFFGLKTGFALNLICLITIILVTGFFSFKYGFENPILISIIAVGLVAIFEFGLGLISVEGIPITVWAFLGLIAIGVKEMLT